MTQKVYFHAPKFILYPGMHLRLEMELYGPDVAGKYEYKEIDGINSLNYSKVKKSRNNCNDDNW